MKILLASIALATTAISTQASAQMPGGGAMQQDMTRQQAQQMADTMFQRLDANHDGTLTRAEADAAAAQISGGGGGRAGRMMDRIFGNAQSLTLQQFEAQSLARFDRDDLNHDGVVTSAERQQVREARRSERGQNPSQ